jgi:hypothetical protein
MQIHGTPQVAARMRLPVRTLRPYLVADKLVGKKVGDRWLKIGDALRRLLGADRKVATSPQEAHFAISKLAERIIIGVIPETLRMQCVN